MSDPNTDPMSRLMSLRRNVIQAMTQLGSDPQGAKAAFGTLSLALMDDDAKILSTMVPKKSEGDPANG